MKPNGSLCLIGIALLGLTNAQIKPGIRPGSGGGGTRPGSGSGTSPGSGGSGINPGSGSGSDITPGSGGSGINPGSGGSGITPGSNPGSGSGINPGTGGSGINPGTGGSGINPGTGGSGINPGSGGGGTRPGSWTCPNPAKGYNPSPPVTTSISCPTSDGSVYETDDGSWYYLQCCTQSSQNALSVGNPTVSSMEECLKKCSDVPNCETVSFEPSTVYCNLLDFGTFSDTTHGSQLYAFSTAPPATKQPRMTTRRCTTTCPEANGQIYVSPYGETFYMSCGMRHGTPYLSLEQVSTLEECMDHCGASPSCSSVDFDQAKGVCYLSNNDSPPTYEASRFASAHSVGCSGACEGCGKGRSASQKTQADPGQCTNDNQVVYVENYPFRVKCDQCYGASGAQAVLKPEAKTHEECMSLYLLEADQYVGAHWLKNDGCILVGAGSTIQPTTNCVAGFVPLWK